MKTVDFKVSDKKTYELRLTTMNTVKLEKKLGKNPISVFVSLDEGALPPLYELLTIVYYALQAKHSAEVRKIDDVFNIYDEYIENGGDTMALIELMIKVFQVSGLMPMDDEADNEFDFDDSEKN